jgi:hypothetical protein
MNLKKRNTRELNVNLIADFIVQNIPKEESTIIQIVDCQNFYVVKGKTSSKNLLDLPKLFEEYQKKFKEFLPEKITNNSIDLIEYDCDLKPSNDINLTLYNTENCSYSYQQISKEKNEKESMIVCSEFPHGFSLNQGRSLYYYFKNILYSIPTNYIFTSLTFDFKKNKSIELKVFNNFFTESDEDETLKSAILDCFDFDTNEIDNKIKKVEWFEELTNPLSEYDFLKEVKKDFIIL